jgi:hypothetical protein
MSLSYFRGPEKVKTKVESYFSPSLRPSFRSEGRGDFLRAPDRTGDALYRAFTEPHEGVMGFSLACNRTVTFRHLYWFVDARRGPYVHWNCTEL